MVRAFDYINETLNELVVKVFSGVDYVSQIALGTGKSIPVVHRQLDSLVKAKFLVRERKGRRVVYGVNWQRIAENINGLLLPDVAHVMQQVHDPELSLSEGEFRAAVDEFLSNEQTRQLLQQFFGAAAQNKQAKKLSFTETMQQFLDVFGMMSVAERNAYAKKIGASKQLRAFFAYCAIHYERRRKFDVREQLLVQIRASLE